MSNQLSHLSIHCFEYGVDNDYGMLCNNVSGIPETTFSVCTQEVSSQMFKSIKLNSVYYIFT